MQRFGNLTQVRRSARALGRTSPSSPTEPIGSTLRQDLGLRYTFAANPTFTLITALTMASGHRRQHRCVQRGVRRVCSGRCRIATPDALVRLWSRNASRGLDFFSVSPADFQSWRAARGFAAMAAFERQHDATLVRQGASSPESVEAATVMPELFALLGTSADRGRTFVPDDARADAPKVAVVSHELWSARFGSSPALVGRQLTLDGIGVTVVGVMPPRFFVPGTPAQVWTPLSLSGASEDHSKRYLRVLARLAPGTMVDAALAQVNTVAAQLARDYPATNGPWTANAMSVTEMIVGRQFRRSVLVLTGVVAFVLLIACANAANLQLAVRRRASGDRAPRRTRRHAPHNETAAHRSSTARSDRCSGRAAARGRRSSAHAEVGREYYPENGRSSTRRPGTGIHGAHLHCERRAVRSSACFPCLSLRRGRDAEGGRTRDGKRSDRAGRAIAARDRRSVVVAHSARGPDC